MQTSSDSHSEGRKSDLISNTSVPSKNNTFEESRRQIETTFEEFYILLTVHHVMILGK
jgi:hypothetical protein